LIASFQALSTLDFPTAARALPLPPQSSESTCDGIIDDAAAQFARNSLGHIVRECVAACGRADIDQGCDNRNPRHPIVERNESVAALKIVIEQLFLWTVRALSMHWIVDADAQVYLKMLWDIADQTGQTNSASTSSPPALPSSVVLTVPPTLHDAALQACLRAAAGDVWGVVSAAEALHCRCDSTILLLAVNFQPCCPHNLSVANVIFLQ
jgi:hypothetical protein